MAASKAVVAAGAAVALIVAWAIASRSPAHPTRSPSVEDAPPVEGGSSLGERRAEVTASAPAPAPAADAPTVIASADAPVCATSVRLADVEEKADGASTAWLADAAGTEAVVMGGRFRGYVLVAVQDGTERRPAVAWLRGPGGVCRTPTNFEQLVGTLTAIENAQPRLPDRALANQLAEVVRQLIPRVGNQP